LLSPSDSFERIPNCSAYSTLSKHPGKGLVDCSCLPFITSIYAGSVEDVAASLQPAAAAKGMLSRLTCSSLSHRSCYSFPWSTSWRGDGPWRFQESKL